MNFILTITQERDYGCTKKKDFQDENPPTQGGQSLQGRAGDDVLGMRSPCGPTQSMSLLWDVQRQAGVDGQRVVVISASVDETASLEKVGSYLSFTLRLMCGRAERTGKDK